MIDFHCDTLAKALLKGELSANEPSWQLDINRLMHAGIRIQVFAICTGSLHEALAMISLFHDAAKANHVRPIYFREDVTKVIQNEDNLPGGLLSLEGGQPLAGDVRILDALFLLGVRALGLTWNNRNQLADGIAESSSKGGLTQKGRLVVQRMNQLGMVVDVSHLSPAGFWDVAQICTAPFIASHSNAYTVCQHPRNLEDDQLRAIAAAGGVVGLNFYPPFLVEEGAASIENILRHADHMLELIGPNHIGLGSDFDGINQTPTDLSDVSALPRLYTALEQRYGRQVAQAIMGGNFTRLLQSILPNR